MEVTSEDECYEQTQTQNSSDSSCVFETRYRNREVLGGTCDDPWSAGGTDSGDENGHTGTGQEPGNPLEVDLSDPMPCVGAGVKSIHDLVLGGDDSDFTCKVFSGVGAGQVPPGVGVDPDSCEITGDLTSIPFGAWAWMVEATQSGANVLVPYCLVQAEEAAGEYPVSFVPTSVDLMLLRLMDVQDNKQQLARLEVRGDNCSAGSCFYGYEYSTSPSPLEGFSFSFDSGLLSEPDPGFWLEPELSWSSIEETHVDRLWLLSIDFDFCISPDADACEGALFDGNRGGRVHLAVLALP